MEKVIWPWPRREHAVDADAGSPIGDEDDGLALLLVLLSQGFTVLTCNDIMMAVQGTQQSSEFIVLLYADTSESLLYQNCDTLSNTHYLPCTFLQKD